MSKSKPNTATLIIRQDLKAERERDERLYAVLAEIGVAIHQLRASVDRLTTPRRPPRPPKST